MGYDQFRAVYTPGPVCLSPPNYHVSVAGLRRLRNMVITLVSVGKGAMDRGLVSWVGQQNT